MSNKRWNCEVSFTVRPHPEYSHHDAPEGAELGPGLIVGQRDSVWVRTRTKEHGEAIEAATRKMALAYGVLIEAPKVITGGGFWHEYGA